MVHRGLLGLQLSMPTPWVVLPLTRVSWRWWWAAAARSGVAHVYDRPPLWPLGSEGWLVAST